MTMTTKIFPKVWAADTMLHKWCVSSIAKETVLDACFRHDMDKLLWGANREVTDDLIREWKDSDDFRFHKITPLHNGTKHHKENVETARNAVEMVSDWVAAGAMRAGTPTPPCDMRYPTSLMIRFNDSDYEGAYKAFQGLNLVDEIAEFTVMAEAIAAEHDYVMPIAEWANAYQEMMKDDHRAVLRAWVAFATDFFIGEGYHVPFSSMTSIPSMRYIATMRAANKMMEEDPAGFCGQLLRYMPFWLTTPEFKEDVITGYDPVVREAAIDTMLPALRQYVDKCFAVAQAMWSGATNAALNSPYPATAARELSEWKDTIIDYTETATQKFAYFAYCSFTDAWSPTITAFEDDDDYDVD